VPDVFVPQERTFLFPDGRSYEPGPLYRGPIIDQLGLGLSAVSLGIARAALDASSDLAGRKTPTRTSSLLRDRATVQAQLAQAEGLVRSARALVFETEASLWETLCAGDPISEEQAALKWLTAVQAATSCAQAVDIVYTLGGATSVYTSSPLERCFRDVHVVQQHAVVSPNATIAAGRYFLGLGLPPR
jgi:alkylation response protein AidB-like acyl-CoA dehydrogenase